MRRLALAAKVLLGGKADADIGASVDLRFVNWKGVRLAVFCYGPNQGAVDVDYVHYTLTQQA
jgi:hypothetical protein